MTRRIVADPAMERPRDPTVHTPVVIPAPGQFVAVRDWLVTLERPRWPIWRLRLAADLVCELQAGQGRGRAGFAGRALWADGAGAADLRQRPERLFCEVRFGVQEADGRWTWTAGRLRWGRGATWEQVCAVRARVLAAFQAQRFDALTLALLLQPACLCCGKQLTDPVSMARLIGPECAGTARQAGVILWDLCESEPAFPANGQFGLFA